jgi:hypothetical protein
MNLHETLTYRRSNAHPVPVAFRVVDLREPSVRSAATRMTHPRRQLSLLILAAVLGALLLLPSGALAAATTCDAGEMIDAAANNRQIAPHTSACYRQALAKLPGDVDSYDPAVRTNLIVAMQRDASATSTRTGNTRALQGIPEAPAAVASVRGPVTSLLQDLGPAHADEVPVPVLALGGAAGLLLLAGLGTSLARLRQRRLTR